MHHQGIFRIPGAQVEINEFKAEFEKGLTVVTNNRNLYLNQYQDIGRLSLNHAIADEL